MQYQNGNRFRYKCIKKDMDQTSIQEEFFMSKSLIIKETLISNVCGKQKNQVPSLKGRVLSRRTSSVGMISVRAG